ncbi:MAG TPA: hypothetical protein VKV03_18200 [Candidatus Binataceae bacterium]|nr:hypothetical protein [Candidatus Binataceae bacterium]
MASERARPDGIKLDSIQREVLLGEITNMLAAPLSSEARAPYQRLRKCVEDSLDIPPELSPHLSIVIESSILSGNAKRFGAGVQQSMVALYQKTMRGKSIAESIDAINAALEKLKGHAIEQVSTTLRAPGSYALTFKTDQLQMVIVFDRAGLSIESLEVNLG